MKKLTCIIILSLFSISCREYIEQEDPLLKIASFFKGEFKAFRVNENAELVYQENASNNIIPGYEQYRLEFLGSLNSNPVVKLKEYTGETFTGKWEILPFSRSRYKLIFFDLAPQPTNTEGRMEFEIESASKDGLELQNLRSNPKTGNTLNNYKLKKT
jgi:hypothetical protein